MREMGSPFQQSRGGEVEVAGGADGGLGEGFAFGEAVGDFVADDGAEFGVGGFFLISVASAAEVEVRAVADVALVFIRPADEAVVAVRLLQEFALCGRPLKEPMGRTGGRGNGGCLPKLTPSRLRSAMIESLKYRPTPSSIVS